MEQGDSMRNCTKKMAVFMVEAMDPILKELEPMIKTMMESGMPHEQIKDIEKIYNSAKWISDDYTEVVKKKK